MTKSPPKRIDLIDSLRGFSLLGILLIHFIEHFNLYYFQSPPLEPYQTLNLSIWESIFFVFSGKAYIIFSYLFGISFFIQYNNQKNAGNDFRLRFAWRMLLLLLFAQLNAMFYPGDILVLYSVVGCILIIMCKASNNLVLWTAIIFMLQPLEWFKFTSSILTADYQLKANLNWNYFKIISPVLANGSFLTVLKTNLWEGQLFSNLWQIENGRVFQTASLFLFGMLSGRKGHFYKTNKNILFWKRVLITGLVGSFSFYFMQLYLSQLSSHLPIKIVNTIIVPSLKNLSFSAVLVAGYILIWHKGIFNRLQKAIIPYGKMSLTNYIGMAIIGSIIFYGYGLSLNIKINIFFSFILAIVVFLVQLGFSLWWLNKFNQGPMEFLWKRLTWIRINK